MEQTKANDRRVLCIRRDSVAVDFLQDAFGELEYRNMAELFVGMAPLLIDKDMAELDPDYLQLLPYVVVRVDTHCMLHYRRGKAYGESRLKGLLSLGFGGHVELQDIGSPGSGSLIDTLLYSANRELQEELGSHAPKVTKFEATIFDPTNEVGRVHLGLLAFVDVTTAQAAQFIGEEHHVNDLFYTDSHDLMSSYGEMEPWSRMVLIDQQPNCDRKTT